MDFYNSLKEDVTVEHVMTLETVLKRYHEDADRLEVLNQLTADKFDQTPIYDSEEKIRWYVEGRRLESDRSTTVKECLMPLRSEHMVGSGTPVVDVFQELSSQGFLYVLKKNRIVGLITYADVNKRPVRALVYVLLGEIESRLISMMSQASGDSNYWVAKLDKPKQRRVEGWYRKRVEEDMGTDILDCFSLEHVLFALDQEDSLLGDVRQILRDYDRQKLVSMRNRVSHQGLDLIDNFESLKEFITEKESIILLLERLDRLSYAR